MLSVSSFSTAKGHTAKGIRKYLVQYLARNNQPEHCRFFGKGAQTLGIYNAFRVKDFEKLLNGKSPDGEQLRKLPANGTQRFGDDFCFSLNKTYSIAYVLADETKQKEIISALQRCSEKSMRYLEQFALCSRGGEKVKADSLVVASFVHFDNRNGEPQLHTHNFVNNLSIGPDGKWGGLDPQEMHRHVKEAGAIFRAEMAKEMLNLGYDINTVIERGKHNQGKEEVWHKVAGVSKEVEEAFSSRRKEIIKAVDEFGCDAQTACLKTRKAKHSLNHEVDAIKERFEASMKENNLQIKHEDLCHARKGIARGLQFTGQELAEKLTTNEALFSEAGIVETLAKYRGLTVNFFEARELREQIEAFKSEAQIFRLDTPKRECYTTQHQKNLEEKMLVDSEKLAQRTNHKLALSQVVAVVETVERRSGLEFSREQLRIIDHATTKTGDYCVIEGKAGAGKTTLTKAIVECYRAEGRNVYGCSLSNSAAQLLGKETGLEASSIESLKARLDRGTVGFDAKSVLIVDEAGMVGSKDFAFLQGKILQAGGKLIAIGDNAQLQPILAGGGFMLSSRNAEKETINEIRRQAKEEDRELARKFYGQGGKQVVEEMEKRGQLSECDTEKEAIKRLVTDYLGNPSDSKLILASTRNETTRLNNEVREQLKIQGVISNERVYNVINEKNQCATLALGVGDEVLFTRKNDHLGVINGTRGRVLETDEGKIKVGVLKNDNSLSKAIEVDLSTYDDLTHGYATTIHKAQGQTRNNVFWFVSDNQMLDGNLALVAYTRYKETIGVYTTGDGKDALIDKIADFQYKQNAIDYRPAVETERAPEVQIELKAERVLDRLKDFRFPPRVEPVAPVREDASPSLRPNPFIRSAPTLKPRGRSM